METNSVTLDARLQSRGSLGGWVRSPPAGVRGFFFALPHLSTHVGGATPRRVACELAAVALGPVARKIADVTPGVQIRCTGFLARRYRTGITVALHVSEFDLKSETNEGN